MPSGYTRSRARFSRDYGDDGRGYSQPPRSNPVYGFLIAAVVIVALVAIILIFKEPIATMLAGGPTPTPTEEITPSPDPTVEPTPEPTPEPTATPEPTPTPTPTPPPYEDLTINAVGGIMVDTPVLSAAKDSSGSYNFSPLLEGIKDQTSNADITLGTLVTTLSGTGSNYTGSPKYNTPDVILSALKDAGFDVLSIAQPHIFDHGYDGAINTKNAIDNANLGMQSSGIYSSSDAYQAAVTPVTPAGKTMSVAVLSYCNFKSKPSGLSSTQWNYVVKSINLERIKKDIDLARSSNAQIIIVMLDWGSSSSKTPTSTMQTQAQKIIKEYGADLVIGNGPQYMQKLEKVSYTLNGVSKQGIIAYSLGNFISENRTTGQDSGAILHVTFEKDNATGAITLKDASYVPTWVYKDSKSVYTVLPAGKYTNSQDLLDTLSSSTAKSRIKKVWDDVQKLFGTDVASPVDALPPPVDNTQLADTSQTGDTGQPADSSGEPPADGSQPTDTPSPESNGEPG